jgi:tetratricopeptide (TPR) repeat protein
LNNAIGELLKYSLVRRDAKNKTFTVHRLVQAVLYDAMEETQRRLWAERAIRVINVVFPNVEYGTWAQCERLLSQALIAARIVARYQVIGEEAGRLLYEIASYLQDRVYYSQAELLYQRALVILQEVNQKHPLLAPALNNLASLYYSLGKYALAEEFCQQALTILHQQVGADRTLAASVRNNLANLYSKQGRYGEAEPLYRQVLASLEQFGLMHPQLVSVLNGLANLYAKQGRYDEAEPLYLRALHIREQQLGFGHPLVASPLSGLANLYSLQGKYAEAELLYQQALTILKQVGTDHPLVASPLSGLANLYSLQGKYAEAELLLQRTLAIVEKQLGLDHPDTVAIRENYNALVRNMK